MNGYITKSDIQLTNISDCVDNAFIQYEHVQWASRCHQLEYSRNQRSLTSAIPCCSITFRFFSFCLNSIWSHRKKIENSTVYSNEMHVSVQRAASAHIIFHHLCVCSTSIKIENDMESRQKRKHFQMIDLSQTMRSF